LSAQSLSAALLQQPAADATDVPTAFAAHEVAHPKADDAALSLIA
jgi:hypothetical protein